MIAGEIEAIQLQRLRSEIQADLTALTEIVRAVEAVMTRWGEPPDPDRTMALAAYLHHWYTGIETIHQRIAQSLEGGGPTGEHWHRDLLRVMALEIPGVRPAVISLETAQRLSDYLGFRHVFRHAYALVLDVERLKMLASRLPALFERYHREIYQFLDHLRDCVESYGTS